MRNEYVVVQLYGYRGLSEKEYWYHTFFDVKEGDEVVVESMYGYAVGRVKGSFDELPKGTDFEILEVVGIVDTTRVKELREREEQKKRLRAEMRSILCWRRKSRTWSRCILNIVTFCRSAPGSSRKQKLSGGRNGNARLPCASTYILR